MVYMIGGLEHFLFFHMLGMSSSQLTKSIIFQRGRYTTNQFMALGLPNMILGHFTGFPKITREEISDLGR